MWYDKTRKEREAGKLQIVSIIEEQHADRCRLFRQWKRLDGPALVDSLNLLGVAAVPLAFFIDEHGVVRSSRATPENLAEFLQRTYEPPAGDISDEPAPTGAKAELARGDALFHSGRDEDLTPAVEAYARAITLEGPPESRFRSGVALRRRYESGQRQENDFRRALESWTEALALQPNQYIWRRRIEQYGPRLEKPYAFYDWVEEARKEITARGEKPVELHLDPRGAEIARPEKTFNVADSREIEPDPEARIARDADRLIRIETAAAPAFVRPGKAARLHLTLRPDVTRSAHWNNEAPQGLTVWIGSQDGLEFDRRSFAPPSPREPESSETREVELEVRLATGARTGKILIPAYALYHVCEGKGGTCRYLRQDFEILIESRS